MSDFAAYVVLGIVALALGWPWWAIVAAFALAAIAAAAELGGPS